MQQHSIPDTRPESPTAPADSIPVVPLRHPVRLAIAVVLIVVALSAAWDVAVNQRYHWDVVVSYLFAPQILAGAGLTILLTVVSMTAGIALGTVLAVMRLSKNPILSTISRGYIWFFRGTPLLVQLIFWYNIAALYPVIAFGLPFGGPSVVLGSANVLISPLTAALLGLALNEAAYMAEIIRGGIGSVDKGQYDAARALGMNGGQLMRRVILPQAMRVVLPPTGNQVISMLKAPPWSASWRSRTCCIRPRSSTPPTTRPFRCSSSPACGTC
ncbi:amino acid ABC transporter permease [Arthrobacter sp. CC3]|uniref:amino acid ABC transporter permease n=1 Tax=Arthrobacter sp. CC3 TaxID=3029185 RepID=UPI0032640BBB